jgi:hypothetical protein
VFHPLGHYYLGPSVRRPVHDLRLRPECPKAHFFLALLYLIVGYAVRTQYRTKKKEEIEALLEKARKQFPKHSIYLWTERSTDLVSLELGSWRLVLFGDLRFGHWDFQPCSSVLNFFAIHLFAIAPSG